MAKDTMDTVIIHSDGACEGNPGPGGWAAVIRSGASRRELSGGGGATTNNRMELQAAIEALRVLDRPSRVLFHTDSEYLRRGISEWLPNWKRRGWRTAGNKPVKNAELWRALEAAAAPHEIAWRWVRGHAGDPENERCDALANEQVRRIKRETSPAELRRLLRAMRTEAEPYGQGSF